MKVLYSVLFLLPFSAQAEPLAKSVSYFMAHPAELRQTVAVCEDNAQFARTPTCVNAEAATAGRRAQTGPDLVAMLSSPQYWSANPIARAAELEACRNGRSMLPQFCRAVGQSALQAVK